VAAGVGKIVAVAGVHFGAGRITGRLAIGAEDWRQQVSPSLRRESFPFAWIGGDSCELAVTAGIGDSPLGLAVTAVS
jgi:hypothetical protein